MKQDIEYYYKWLQAFFNFYETIPQSEQSKNLMLEFRRITDETYKKGSLTGIKHIYRDMQEMTKSPKIQHKVGLCIAIYQTTGERDEKIEQQIDKFFSKSANIKHADSQVPHQQWLNYIRQFS